MDVCERLRQQTTCKDFALSQPGTADATAHHKLSAQPFTVDAKLARSLARALLRGGSAATTDGDSLRGGSAATTDGDGKSFSAIWAARAAERACVAIGVLQGATAPLVEASVPAALVFALRCAVEASDAARASLFATAILTLLHAIDFSDKASRLEISNQLVQAGFIQVASTVAATRGDAMSRLRNTLFCAFSKLNLLSWPSMYCLPASLVTNLLELAAASMPDPNAEEALFALHTIVRTNGKSDELRHEGPLYKFPLQTLGGLVTPRGLSNLADIIRCGAISNASEFLTDLVRCDYKDVGVPSSFCSAIAESPVIDAILDIIGYDDAATRAYLELKPNQGKYVRTHTGFTGEFCTKPDPRPLALELLSTVMDFHGFGDGERLRPAIAPIVRVLRLTCQEGAQPCPDTFETRLHALHILARLCGTKYRLSRDVLRQGGLDAAIRVLERLKLPGSTATPRLLRTGIWDATLPLFALAAAGHLASSQAALVASPEILRVSDVITGEAGANNATRLKFLLTMLSTCSDEDWASHLLTCEIGKHVVSIGTR